jgi:hypothetical protein
VPTNVVNVCGLAGGAPGAVAGVADRRRRGSYFSGSIATAGKQRSAIGISQTDVVMKTRWWI